MKLFLLSMLTAALSATALHAQAPHSVLKPQIDGRFQGYDGEWVHVSRQLLELAEAIPAAKYAWRPGPGVRSVSEVYMHIALTNFHLLGVIGQKIPAEVDSPKLEAAVTDKARVIDWLKRSLEAVKTARATVTPADLARPTRNGRFPATVDTVYLRIIIHNNEHMGQLVAYARMNGIVPPWSQ